ncbi:transglycosylase SLT domain-containing protein [Citrobacter freundii]|uniref:transglycosylase SLT domain-containing protein n=1 Tax=Citrobacter freundii TaxID=546 RepID=UPI001906A8D4|nr:transglycosylase SLT domain-containing protein [Citrobacter freundii]MBJ8931606.1 transglycosylase SLT domain-containing protein [Citrobacter freundii]
MKSIFRKIFLYTLLATSSACYASINTSQVLTIAPPRPIDDPELYAVRPATIQCVIAAAHKYNNPANILLAISSMESGKNGQVVKNTNGSYDMGHFQINTIHWEGNKFDGVIEIDYHDVAQRGCYNAALASWILKKRLLENSGVDYWTKVANYHSKTEKFNSIYKRKLIPLAIEWGKWLERNGQFVVTYK